MSRARAAPLPAPLQAALDSLLGVHRRDRRWLVAYSGGLDSTALLLAVHAWCAANPRAPALSAVHVHHSLHADADAWAAHCATQCSELGVPLVQLRVTPEPAGRGLEAAAREARYAAFANLLQPADCLLLAHHLDDQLETFMLRLLRGAGPAALAGMPQQRALGEGSLLRPLLSLPRVVLHDYVKSCAALWLDDPSNRDIRHDRNYLRHEVLPRLEARWPGYRQPFAAALQDLAEQAAALTELEPALSPCSSLCGDPGFGLASLLALESSAAARALRRWLADHGCAPPRRAPLLEFLRQLRSGTRGAPLLQGAGWRLQRYGGVVLLQPLPLDWRPGDAQAVRVGQRLLIEGVGQVQVLPREAPGLSADQTGLAAQTQARAEDQADGRLWLAFRRGGERLRLRPEGPSRELKQLLQEGGVPPWWRLRMPLLLDEQGVLAAGSRWVVARSPWQLQWRPVLGATPRAGADDVD